ncbi:MAG: DUF1573 domain-containing protein [Isosphaeraceae bacterium]
MSPDPISLGVLSPGEGAEALASVRNIGARTVVVARVETSCPCVQVSQLPIRLGDGQTASLRILFDPSKEPGFCGGLTVHVRGYGERSIVFCTRVSLTVSAAKQGAQGEEADPRRHPL